LSQLYTFTKNEAGKYVAEDGYKDDNIMALAVSFAPFMESIRFDDYDMFIKQLRANQPDVKTKDFMSYLDLAFTDDGIDDGQEKLETRLKELRDSGVQDDYGLPSSEGFSTPLDIYG
jgi:hypothetical protein